MPSRLHQQSHGRSSHHRTTSPVFPYQKWCGAELWWSLDGSKVRKGYGYRCGWGCMVHDLHLIILEKIDRLNYCSSWINFDHYVGPGPFETRTKHTHRKLAYTTAFTS